MLRFWFVFSATTFSSYNPDIAKNRVMPQISLASPGFWPGPTPNLEGNLNPEGRNLNRWNTQRTLKCTYRPISHFTTILESILGPFNKI